MKGHGIEGGVTVGEVMVTGVAESTVVFPTDVLPDDGKSKEALIYDEALNLELQTLFGCALCQALRKYSGDGLMLTWNAQKPTEIGASCGAADAAVHDENYIGNHHGVPTIMACRGKKITANFRLPDPAAKPSP